MNRILAFAMLLMLVLLGFGTVGCGALVTFDAKSDKYNAAPKSSAALKSDEFMLDAARRFGLMALFSEVVYRRDLKDAEKDGQGCRYLEGKQKSDYELNFGMPKNSEDDGGWKRWIPEENSLIGPPCLDQAGLYYETYVHIDKFGAIDEAVIAFRGTENRWGQYFDDWSANLVAALGFEPRQHALVRSHIPPLVDRLLAQSIAESRPIKIYATGHSLGGGLAQEAGYLRPEILEAFTFNTSPVTNWSYLRRHKAVANDYPIFHRIYNGGEFLEVPRFISTTFTAARFGRHDIGLQLTERKSFSGHGMSIIACNFADLIASHPAIEGAHNYSVDYITRAVLWSGNEKEKLSVCSKPENS